MEYVQFAVFITKNKIVFLASFTFANVPVKLVFSMKCKCNLIEDQVRQIFNEICFTRANCAC